MTGFPKDILEAARKVVGKPNAAISEAGANTMVRIIASALCAERERCAKIAESMHTDYYGDPSGDIAEAIRGVTAGMQHD